MARNPQTYIPYVVLAYVVLEAKNRPYTVYAPYTVHTCTFETHDGTNPRSDRARARRPSSSVHAAYTVH
jgi:hypothetical protein